MSGAADPIERNTRPLRKDFDQARIGFVKGETSNLGPPLAAQVFEVLHNLVESCNSGAGQLLSFENHIQFAMVTRRDAQQG